MRRALLLVASLGCASSAPPAQPTLVRTKQLSPLEFRDDARLPGQAVILGTDGGIGSTVLALPARPAPVTVDAMTAGGLVAITVVAAPSPAGTPAEALVRGGRADDARWTAGLWSAARAAADALGKDLADVAFVATPSSAQIGAQSGTQIDAPALLAAGFLASLTGAAVDPAVTLAGGLAPDGTITPSDGVAAQVAAALARGKKRIGVPVGARADLLALARARHADLVEITTVHDAYQLLTKKPLPAPVAVDERDMALDPDALRALDAAYATWQPRLAGEWAALLQLEQAGVQPPAMRAAIQAAKQRAHDAEALHRAHAPALAYRAVVAAAGLAATANRSAGVLALVAAGKLDAARAALAAVPVDDPASVLAQITALRPTRLAGELAMLGGLADALRAWLLARPGATSDPIAAGPDAIVGANVDAIVDAIARRFGVAAELDAAQQRLALVVDHGPRSAGTPDGLAREAAARHAELTARLAELTRDVAEHDRARRALAALGRDLAALPALADAPRALDAGPGALAFVAADAALDDAAAIAARFAVLARCADAAPSQPCDALAPWLTVAARTARAAARAARIATGGIPLAARLHYQQAIAQPPADLAAQLAALDDLWAATAVARLAVLLARSG